MAQPALLGQNLRMSRTPLTRTLLATLPVCGALLSGIAGMRGWPIPLSVLAMATVAAACSAIYWPVPAKAADDDASVETVTAPSLASESLPIAAAAEPAVSLALQSMPPEQGSVGTRADTLVTGQEPETDLLTGLLAPQAFFARVTSELDRCRAAGQTATLMICDLDQFQRVNQHLGLIDANQLLRHIADRFRATVRDRDVLSRLGGDEFGIFFPGLTPETAENRVRDLRAALRDAGLEALPAETPQLTASLGMSHFPAEGQSIESLMAIADRGLADAKRERAETANRPTAAALLLTRS